MILCDLTILPLSIVALWYFWGVGVVDMIFDAFWYHLCNIVIFLWLREPYFGLIWIYFDPCDG